MDDAERLKEIQEATDYALSYVCQHGKEGRWSYDMMREALVKINGLTGHAGPFAEDMKDDRVSDQPA